MADFPILMSPANRLRFPDCPKSVPWALVMPHAARAKLNHDQTLERLAQRGGLCPTELRAAVEDKPLDFSRDPTTLPAAVEWLARFLSPAYPLPKPVTQ